MSNLSDAANTLFPAVLALRDMGFDVTRAAGPRDEEWTAERGSDHLIAGDPLRLLGLACLLDRRGYDWRATDAQIAQLLVQYGPASSTSDIRER